MTLPESNSTATSRNLDDAVEQCPSDIYRHGVDQTKCIFGTIFMTWPNDGKENEKRVIATVRSTSQEPHRFEILFKTSKDSLSTLTLAPHDEFRLSLYGAEIEKLPQIPKISTLAFKLVYTRGVHIKWKSQGSPEEMYRLNTWILDDATSNSDDIWYGTPSATLLQSKRRQDEVSPHEETRPRENREDKKRRRLEAKRQKSKPMVVDEKMEVSGSKTPLAAVSVQNDGPQVPENSSSPPTIISRTSPHEEPSGGLQAGFRGEGVVYTALKDIQVTQLVNLIGIVTSMSEPTRTKTGDWMRFVHIVDPSNSEGLKVNFFTRKYPEWLPHPEGWHVLILRNVKVQYFNDALVGTGYGNKLRWAAFSPSTNSIYHGKLKNVPREEGLAEGGFGVTFSPFYEPKEGELQYCSKLSEWWRQLQNIEQSESTKHAVDVVRNPTWRRIHRLISEAGPSVPPEGYFDCTVEILKEFHNFNGVHTIYVTDYTRNDQMATVQSNWCPTSLSDFVLQMEMWDDAAEVARTMREGEYYLIRNARMRASLNGYLEGKVAQSKIVKLEETDAEMNIHLQSLLERKKIWADKELAKPDTEIEHQLIQDAGDAKFFHCTVELVHADYGTSDIYVTDYTLHPRLGIIAVGEAWSKGLEKRIARIRLSEQQRHIAESAVAGDFYSIKKLRLKYSPTEECFRGFLGGSERLIQVLNPLKTDNEHLKGLLRRRSAWQQKGVQAPSVSLTRPSPTTTPRHSYTRIKDIDPDDTSIQKYRIFARAVDFYPLKLEDAFYQFCKHCNVEVPKSQKACFGCSDFEHEHIQYLYQLYIMIEDEDEKQIMVSINDECSLLEGLKRVYMPNDAEVLRNFQSRLKPLLGNLTMVHSALLSEKKIEIDSPLGVYEVDSWVISKGKRAFCLVGHDKNVTSSS